jgi:hypothetical protein
MVAKAAAAVRPAAAGLARVPESAIAEWRREKEGRRAEVKRGEEERWRGAKRSSGSARVERGRGCQQRSKTDIVVARLGQRLGTPWQYVSSSDSRHGCQQR